MTTAYVVPDDPTPPLVGPDRVDIHGDGTVYAFGFAKGENMFAVHNAASSSDGAQTSVAIVASLDKTNWTDVNFQGADSAGPSLSEGGFLMNESSPGVVAGASVPGASTTVSAGSNGIMAASLTGTQPLHVASTAGFASAGSFLLTMNVGNCTVTYTAKNANTFLNCSHGSIVGTDGVATGNTCVADNTTAADDRLFVLDHSYPYVQVLCEPSASDLLPTVVGCKTP